MASTTLDGDVAAGTRACGELQHAISAAAGTASRQPHYPLCLQEEHELNPCAMLPVPQAAAVSAVPASGRGEAESCQISGQRQPAAIVGKAHIQKLRRPYSDLVFRGGEEEEEGDDGAVWRRPWTREEDEWILRLVEQVLYYIYTSMYCV